MANTSLGVIAVNPGTPVRITSNDPTWAHGYMVEAWGATGGDGYVGSSAMNKSTGAGVYGRIPKSTSTQYNAFTSTCATQDDLFNMANIYLDGDVSGSYLVSIIEA